MKYYSNSIQPSGPDYEPEPDNDEDHRFPPNWSKPKLQAPKPTILNFLAGHFDRQELKEKAKFKRMASRILKSKSISIVSIKSDFQNMKGKGE
jgi:hypothetical protein